jgi:glycosyltransferase involved in cell wall biosynthesis
MPSDTEESKTTNNGPAALYSASLSNFQTNVNTLPLRADGVARQERSPASQAWEREIHVPTLGRSARDQYIPLIVHCHLRWDFVWQRPQQIFSRMAERHRVLFVEDPLAGEGEPRLDISEPYANVVRVVPVLPAGLSSTDEQCAVVLPLLHKALREHPLLVGKFDAPVQWFYSPMTAPSFLGQFGAQAVVYDCMDELANFRFAPPDISAREQFLLSRADVVFTGGFQLFESKSKHHGNVHFYGCGVDIRHFGKARLEATQVPAEVAGLPKPVFGYFGVIDERLDYPLIEALAQRFPEASVVMAGPLAKVEREQLPDLPNIYWLGQRDYAELPALVKGFDVCLMPFALNDATRYINPTKTLEYMAAGKPIVSTAVADVVRNFTPIVDVARSQEEFLEAVDRACRAPDSALIAQGIAKAEHASWSAIVQDMERDIRATLHVDAGVRSMSTVELAR